MLITTASFPIPNYDLVLERVNALETRINSPKPKEAEISVEQLVDGAKDTLTGFCENLILNRVSMLKGDFSTLLENAMGSINTTEARIMSCEKSLDSTKDWGTKLHSLSAKIKVIETAVCETLDVRKSGLRRSDHELDEVRSEMGVRHKALCSQIDHLRDSAAAAAAIMDSKVGLLRENINDLLKDMNEVTATHEENLENFRQDVIPLFGKVKTLQNSTNAVMVDMNYLKCASAQGKNSSSKEGVDMTPDDILKLVSTVADAKLEPLLRALGDRQAGYLLETRGRIAAVDERLSAVEAALLDPQAVDQSDEEPWT